MMRQALLSTALLIASALPGVAAAEQKTPAPEEVTVVGQRPVAPVTPTTSYWVEDAYPAYPLLGADFAQGMVIWNHAEPWDGTGSTVPPIRAMEGLASLGWDVVRLQRNSRLNGNAGLQAGGWGAEAIDVPDAIRHQIATAKAAGYRRIILAGQDVGGALSMEAGKTIEDLYAIVAFAPNTGIRWGGKKMGVVPLPQDDYAQVILTNTWDQLEHLKAGRLMVLFPAADEQVPHERGRTARQILNARRDIPFLLVDETSDVRTTAGADTPQFDAYASCLDLFLSPELTPKPGEFHCNADEIPTALAQMGAKPHGGEAWFGYASNAQTIYVELPANGQGPGYYGWGGGWNGKTRPGVRAIDVKPAGDTFTASLTPNQSLRGVHIGAQLRLTIDRDDGTRVSVVMHRLPGNS